MQDYYMRMRSNFRIKNAVSQHPLVVKVNLKKIFRDKDDDDHVLSRRQVVVMFYIYKILRSLFTIFYFYFFPMLVIYLPF